MSQNPDHDSSAANIESERSSFGPHGHPPLRDPKSNPRGVRHIDKTAQDHMALGDRPRYQAARGRRARMIAAASAAKRRLRGLTAGRTTRVRSDSSEPKA